MIGDALELTVGGCLVGLQVFVLFRPSVLNCDKVLITFGCITVFV